MSEQLVDLYGIFYDDILVCLQTATTSKSIESNH